MSIELTTVQSDAVRSLCSLLWERGKAVLTGYAGTGKTTVTVAIARSFSHFNSLFITAPTHKAVSVLRQKCDDAGGLEGAEFGTIHSVLGLKPEGDSDKGAVVLRSNGKSKLTSGSILIIDEASMISRALLAEIMRQAAQKSASVLFVGDPAQLPPVKEKESPAFTQGYPQVHLTEIIRQRENNPILEIAGQFRLAGEGKPFPELTESRVTAVDDGEGFELVTPDEFERRMLDVFQSDYYEADPDYCRVFTWTNDKSHYFNRLIRRALLGQDADSKEIIRGERLVLCNSIGDPSKPVGTLVKVDTCSRETDGYQVEIHRVNESLLVATKHDRHPTEIAELRGARLVVSVETGEGRRLNEPLIKQMSGGDWMKGHFMRQDNIEFEPTHKLALATNHKPKIRGTDLAIWRRIRLIPFTVTIPPEERDPNLVEKLKAEMPGILAWAVQGCLDWQKEGLEPPKEVTEATDLYKAESDVLAAFLADCCVVDKNAKAKAAELFNAYRNWCEQNGERMNETQTSFGLRLTERGLDKERVTAGVFYKGVCLRNDVYDEGSI